MSSFKENIKAFVDGTPIVEEKNERSQENL